MAIYCTRLFDRKTKNLDITDAELLQAAAEIAGGGYEADLGGGVIKKRLALNAGKSGGARLVIFFKAGRNLFFFDGWAKNDIPKNGKEISDADLRTFKSLAKDHLAYTDSEIEKMLKVNIIREVK